ncbi:MAG TPA: hypothetical protein VJ793_24790 [Anaerolineae bacterium]|nr:hypothetical protein [Pyrinomonadaceae bacterium]HKZ86857.1 hypothetical protein [Anaerolineae bacterium]
MRKPRDPNDYELRDEYDFSKMTIVAKGRYAPHRRLGKNVVLLAPDVVRAFPSDESVNEALRLVMQIAKIPSKRRAKVAHTPKAKARAAASPRLVKQGTA